MPSPFAWYREFVPCEALRADVYAFFSFVPGPALASASRSLLREVAFRNSVVCAPQFADGQVSIRFEVGQTCDVEGRWRADSNAFGETLIGPMSGVTPASLERVPRAHRYRTEALQQAGALSIGADARGRSGGD